MFESKSDGFESIGAKLAVKHFGLKKKDEEKGPLVFGREIDPDIKSIPPLFTELVNYIGDSSPKAGVFCRMGKEKVISAFIEKVEQPKKKKPYSISDDLKNIINASAVLILFLTQMPKKLIPIEDLSQRVLIEIGKRRVLSGKGRKSMKKMLDSLPRTSSVMLLKLCSFLHAYQAHSAVTGMDLTNLCIIFGKVVIGWNTTEKKEVEGVDFQDLIENKKFQIPLLLEIVKHHEKYLKS